MIAIMLPFCLRPRQSAIGCINREKLTFFSFYVSVTYFNISSQTPNSYSLSAISNTYRWLPGEPKRGTTGGANHEAVTDFCTSCSASHMTLLNLSFIRQICKKWLLIKCLIIVILTPQGVLQHAVLQIQGEPESVSVSLWFITFTETFPVDACVPACMQKRWEGQEKRRVGFSTKCHGNVHLLSAAVTQTSPRNEVLIGWLADWPSERMNG